MTRRRRTTAKTRTATSAAAKFDFNDAGPQSSIDYDEVIRNGAPNGQRSPNCSRPASGTWRRRESQSRRSSPSSEQYPHGIGEKYAGRLHEEVERSYEKWQEERQPKPAPDTEREPEEPLALGQGRQERRPKTDLHQCATRADRRSASHAATTSFMTGS